MTASQVLEIHREIAQLAFNYAPTDWKIFRINMEMVFDENQELDASSMAVYCYKGNALEQDMDYLTDDDLDERLYEYFEVMNNLSLSQGERWTVCDFVITDTGKYKVNYSYDKPPRLSGDILAGEKDTRPSIEPYI
ncbi:hypothetical protein [Chamaesiphon polymorphus]|uniref:DUF600 domain-containing protein n=1 Tax=Chamaesiphon polymorphus CCALA 037 TaxID=2107692 RepID=A0A2T1GKJ8_9CYAN|nr:hypothetical protein [Chamaesiphon polymorphus]PSB58371.1 hypothetical protein C7B77_05065 [Chamaesiphon polymorphus CCALA 037]